MPGAQARCPLAISGKLWRLARLPPAGIQPSSFPLEVAAQGKVQKGGPAQGQGNPSLPFRIQDTTPTSQGLRSAGRSPCPGALASGLTGPPPPPPGSAHTSLGQEPAPSRGEAEASEACLPEEAPVSEKGQKPCLQTLLRQDSGVRPAGH